MANRMCVDGSVSWLLQVWCFVQRLLLCGQFYRRALRWIGIKISLKAILYASYQKQGTGVASVLAEGHAPEGLGVWRRCYCACPDTPCDSPSSPRSLLLLRSTRHLAHSRIISFIHCASKLSSQPRSDAASAELDPALGASSLP